VDAKEFYGIDENGVFEKSLDLYRKAVALDPKNFILASDYANSFYGTKPPRYEDGLVAWEAAYQVAGDDIEREGVCIHLARCHINLKRYDQAEAQLQRVKHPMYDELRKRLADRIARERAGTSGSEKDDAPAPQAP
jgi:tetratricopeptide (TPR) repeat protein